MEQPEMFSDGTNNVLKLNKAIYGLKQADRVWNSKLNTTLEKYGLLRSKYDSCIYYASNKLLILAIYVDDFLIFYKEDKYLISIKKYLNDNLKMKDVGIAKSCIGMNIKHSDDYIELDQANYSIEILNRFGMQDCKPVQSPSSTSTKLSIKMVSEENDLTGKVGSLLYLAQVTRPDIAFAVNDVSRFNNRHSIEHWTAVKRIFRYIKGTTNYKLHFSKNNNLIGYTDADWASDIDKRRSCSGHVFKWPMLQ